GGENLMRACKKNIIFIIFAFCSCLPVILYGQEDNNHVRNGEVKSVYQKKDDSKKENSDKAEAAATLEAEEVVVTATRSEKNTFDVPYAAASLSINKLQKEKMARTLPEALLEEPGVMVQKTAHGQGSPYIRGLTGYSTLLLIDGIRLNNSVFRSGPNQYWTTVDANTIERLEVVKGPSSVLYGSDALGGVVNAITTAPLYNMDEPYGVRTVNRFASAERSYCGRGEFYASSKQLAVLAGGTYKTFGDLICGENIGKQDKTAYDEWFSDLKVSYLLPEKKKLTFAYYKATQTDVPRTHSLIYIEPWCGTTTGGDICRNYDQNRDIYYLQLHVAEAKTFFHEAKFSISYQIQAEELRRQKNNSNTTQYTGFNVGTTGLWADFKTNTDAGLLTYGCEFYNDSIDSYTKNRDMTTGLITSTRPRGVVADNSSYDLAGLFLQDEVKLSEPLTLILGTRYNYAYIDAVEVDPDPSDAYPFNSFSHSYDSVVSSARMSYKIRPGINLICGFSQGFRAPNLSDTTSFEDVRTNSVDVPSPNLSPERSNNCEIGIKLNNKKVTGEIFYFYTFLDDFIRRVPTTYQGQQYADAPLNTIRYYGKENFGKSHIEGVDVKTNYKIDKEWSLFGYFMWMEGKGDDLVNGVKTTTYLSRMAPTQGKLGIRWTDGSEKYWVETYSIITAKQDKLSPDDESDTSRIPPGGTPGYVLYNIRSGFKINKNMNVSAAVENISNTDYRIHGSGINGPGRNLVFSFEMKF
ncbi:MAG: TonB-dependent receptor, partial [Planctomycetota bacterium]